TFMGLAFAQPPSANTAATVGVQARERRDGWPAPNTRGHKSVLVLTLRSASNPTRCTNATMNAVFFTDNRSIAGYYAENSYGQMTISGEVSGPYTVDMTLPCTYPNRQKWADAADAAAAAAGVNVGAYDSKVYILPPESTTKCNPPGLAVGHRVYMRDDY